MNLFHLAVASVTLLSIGLPQKAAGMPSAPYSSVGAAQLAAATPLVAPPQSAPQILPAPEAQLPSTASLHPLIELAGLFSLAVFVVLHAARTSRRW